MRYVAMGCGAALWCLGLLAAEAAPAAHPDFSGVWGTYVEPGARSIRQLRGSMNLPFKPDARKRVEEYRALVTPTDDNPGKFCLGYGMPESMVFSGAYPMQIIPGRDLVFIVYEAYHETRQLNLDGNVIAPGDRVPDRDGYSVAHWEGDTLVVETTSLKEQEDSVYPHSENARITERYHLTKDAKGAKVLENDWTLVDPDFYTGPVTGVKKWAFEPHGVFLPYECNEEGWLDHLEMLRKAKDANLPPVY